MKIIDYLREVRGEIHHVNFPTRGQTATITALVIAISVVTAYFLGAFDFYLRKRLTFLLCNSTHILYGDPALMLHDKYESKYSTEVCFSKRRRSASPGRDALLAPRASQNSLAAT